MGRRGLALARAHRRGRRAVVPVLRDGHRLPVGAKGGRHRGRRSVPRRRVLHQPLAARGRRLHRQAGRGHRHRLLGIQSIPLIAEQAAAADRVPAHRQLLDPRAQRPPSAGSSRGNRGRPRRPTAMRRRCRAAASLRSRSSSPRRCVPRRSAARVSRRHGRPASCFAILGIFADQAVNPESNEIVAEMIREKIRSIVDRRRDRRVAVPEGLLLRHQAAVPRHRLLRDLQPAARASGRPAQGPDHDDHRDRHRHGRRLARVRRDRLRHRLRRDDRRAGRRRHHRPGRRHAEGEVGRRPDDLPRPDDGRVPQLLRHHRPGQPVGAVEHGGVDRAARRLGRRHASRTCGRGASTRSSRPSTAEAGWVQHVNDCADITLLPDGELLVHGRQRAGQAARVPALHRRRRRRTGTICDEVVARRLPRLPAFGARGRAVQRRRGPPAAARRRDGARHDGRARPAAARDR